MNERMQLGQVVGKKNTPVAVLLWLTEGISTTTAEGK